ncbi:adenylate/guanylate cyclase domain-containing protein [Bradyrhizobium sp. 143]|nr:adenylate/guanylate cyclase domain-containing protein [Bradyrhizobium sp. 143]MCK1724595.1 adenylate/guanylate cyclase domain-containing protein [Bradyrhizobium sp. 142]
MHSLLSRQLRKHLGIKDEVPEELKAFIAAVDAGYISADNQRALLERSLELSSQELSEANERVRLASEEIALKNKRLESLSSKLAKYLSPQVYDSIFSGKQEVRITSDRKRLTVFFSDIAGFTETSERLESEDLTQLLNHYLTEMSRIALSFGATVDKYVGDAIVAFFGDPETQGIKEDALACVKMAIAMRERLHDLRHIWRDAGIEKPLECRIGINTGYCTVGNFGSEDRMEYTIIGSGVNLAARLESAATPGEIPFAHVKDEVYCEECEPIKVKGFSHLIHTYRVIDLHENLKEKHEVRAEMPHFKLDANFKLMSDDERQEAALLLREMLARLSIDSVAVLSPVPLQAEA